MKRVFHQSLMATAFLSVVWLTGCGDGDSSTHQPKLASEASTSPTTYPTSIPVENSGSDCEIPPLAEYDQLTTPEEFLPDPFASLYGKRIAQKSDWRCRRAEIGAQAQHYELGQKPPAPDTITGALKGNTFTVSMEQDGKSISFDVTIELPAKGTPPYPAVIGMGAISLDKAALLDLGVALVTFPNNDIAEQLNAQSRGKGKFYDLYGSDHSAGAMMAWSWGVSRLIDALEKTDAGINAAKLGVTGCSRNGKGAIIAGAFDERIALTIGQESGAGGAASWRIAEAQRAAGQNVQTLRQIVTENVWFTENFKNFSETVTLLPIDHHAVMGMIAPRGLLIVDNSIEWLGIESTYAASVIAREIWSALGFPDHMGIQQLHAHPHCQQPEALQSAINAFVQKFLLDDESVDTAVVKTENNFVVDKNRWMNWTTPNLL